MKWIRLILILLVVILILILLLPFFDIDVENDYLKALSSFSLKECYDNYIVPFFEFFLGDFASELILFKISIIIAFMLSCLLILDYSWALYRFFKKFSYLDVLVFFFVLAVIFWLLGV